VSKERQIVFWGATGQAKVLRELVRYSGYTVAAIFDNDPSRTPPFNDVPLGYGDDGFYSWLTRQDGRSEFVCLAAIGGAEGRARIERQRFMEACGLQSIIAVHPNAYVAAGTQIGPACQILAGATICVDARLGYSCILNTSASVDHECALGDGVHIGPGATLAGSVSVGDCSFIGAGAVVLPRVTIGTDAIVGAGSVVTRDVPDGVVAYGNPAVIHRKISDVRKDYGRL